MGVAALQGDRVEPRLQIWREISARGGAGGSRRWCGSQAIPHGEASGLSWGRRDIVGQPGADHVKGVARSVENE